MSVHISKLFICAKLYQSQIYKLSSNTLRERERERERDTHTHTHTHTQCEKQQQCKATLPSPRNLRKEKPTQHEHFFFPYIPRSLRTHVSLWMMLIIFVFHSPLETQPDKSPSCFSLLPSCFLLLLWWSRPSSTQPSTSLGLHRRR